MISSPAARKLRLSMRWCPEMWGDWQGLLMMISSCWPALKKNNKKIQHFWFAWWRWCHCVSDYNTWISSGPTGINAYPSDDKDHTRTPHTEFWQGSCPAAVLKARCQSQTSHSWVSVHLAETLTPSSACAWKTSAKQQDAVKPHSRSENTVRGRGQGNDGCCRIHIRGMKTEYLSSDFLILETSFLNSSWLDVWQSVKTKEPALYYENEILICTLSSLVHVVKAAQQHQQSRVTLDHSTAVHSGQFQHHTHKNAQSCTNKME